MIALDYRSGDLTPAPRPGQRTWPCSQAQLRFWFEEQLHPANPGLNVAVRWRLEGTLSDAVLSDAWHRLILRHATLRTSFALVGDEPIQVVHEQFDFAVGSIDLRALSTADAERAAAQLAQTEARKPFDLAAPPLIRVTRLIFDDGRSELLVTAHHAICDGWSIGILAREMGTICEALAAGCEPDLPALPIDYAGFATWDRERVADGSLAAEIAYARELLHNYAPFELLPDAPRPAVQTSNGAIASILMDRALTDAAGDVAREAGCTLFMTSLAALLTLLHRYSGATDITLGTQVVGRDELELEGVVGCFINTIALRSDVSGDPTFMELLERTRETVTGAFDIRELPLETLIDIVKPKRDLSRNALFSVNFIYQRSFIENSTYGDFKLIDLPSRSAGALYDLNFFMVERPEGWRIACEYNTDLFEAATVRSMLDRFCNVLGALVADPKGRISTAPVLSAVDRQMLIVGANQTRREYAADQSLAQLFAAQVARTPDSPAVVCDGITITYAQLDAAANRLAHRIVLSGHRRGARIGIVLDRSPELVVALLAVAKSGCTYVPLDPSYPAERLAHILEASRLSAVVTRSRLVARLGATPLMLIDVDDPQPDMRSDSPPDSGVLPDDLAYIIFTSGSTGLPKGVQITQRNLVNLLCAMRECPGIGPSDTLVAVSTISFDIAGLELFLPLISGAKLVIATHSEVLDADALRMLLHHHRATIMQATPITWRLLIDSGWRGDPAFKILCGGEALPRALADELLERGEVWNLYGPTETTIWSSLARIEPGNGPISIGRPIANTQFYVVDPNGELVPPGAAGELYIGGDGVAAGYFDRPDLTAERFVTDRFSVGPQSRLYRTGDIVRMRSDFTFECLGRRDQQIKLRGFRIELGEIEAVLLRETAIAQAVAALGVDALGEPAIWAAIVPFPGSPHPTQAWLDALRSRLAEFLPAYMLPATIVCVAILPRTPNGKVDRAALQQPAIEPAHEGVLGPLEAPIGPIETDVAQLVSDLLGRARIRRNDDFFALGFHSLLAVRLVARIAQTFGTKLPLRAVFEYPNVAELARRIAAEPPAIKEPDLRAPIVAYNAAGTQPPFLYFHNDVWLDGHYCKRLATFLGHDQPLLAIGPHAVDRISPASTIEAMASDCCARILDLVPAGPYRIGGFCAGGYVAVEVARLLRAHGKTVANVVLVNASAPARRAVLCGDSLLRRIGLDARLDPVLREKLCWNVVRLFEALGDGPKPTLRFVLGRVQSLLKRSRTAPSTTDEPEGLEKQRGALQTENYFVNLTAAYTYHPAPFDGEVTLLWGTAQPTPAGDSTMGWSAFVKHVEVVPMSGGHLSPLRENVDEVGHLLARLLKTVRPA